MANNQITKITKINNLKKLTILSLTCNKITEIKGINNLANLTDLYLDDNKITEIQITNLINLRKFKCVNSQIINFLNRHNFGQNI